MRRNARNIGVWTCNDCCTYELTEAMIIHINLYNIKRVKNSSMEYGRAHQLPALNEELLGKGVTFVFFNNSWSLLK